MLKNKRLIFILVFILCLFIQVIPVIRSGLNYSYGIGFWGANGHDGVWHLSLINHIKSLQQIPLPIFAGHNLRNYHPFFDILISQLSAITTIPTINWLFQLFPLISSLIFLILSYFLGKKITQKHSGGLWLMFLNSFANSFGWLITIIRFGNIDGESLFWAMQSPSNQINPPFVLSLIFLLALMLIVLNKKLSTIDSLMVFLILILIPITKAYAAIPAYVIFFYFAWQSILKKNFQPLLLGIISLIVALFIFFQFNSQSGNLLVFKPLWFTNSMIESPDRFYVPYLANMRYALEASGRIGPRLIFIHLLAISIFIIGNFSWRIIGFFDYSKKHFAYLISIIICSIIPILFIQNGTAWNTIQFIYYGLFLSNVLLAYYLSKHHHLWLNLLIIFTFLIASIPTIKNYLGNPAPSSLPPSEILALKFLSQQPSGTVLTYPYDKYLKKSLSSPIPLYAYETTSYVAAFSHQQTFVDDYMNLANSGFDYQTRLQASTNFFLQQSEFQDRGFLVNNQIDYIYLTGQQIQKTNINPAKMYLTKIYDQPDVIIYRVQR